MSDTTTKQPKRKKSIVKPESLKTPTEVAKQVVGTKKKKPTDIATVTPVNPPRNYSTELKSYLSLWKYKQENGSEQVLWKFNKILQSWALDNCLDKELIDNDIFDELVPYLGTVQGMARSRLCERVTGVLESAMAQYSRTDSESTTKAEEPKEATDPPPVVTSNAKITKSMIKRAVRIKNILN